MPRKLKLQVQLSVDGFIAGPNGEMDWMIFDWDEPLKQYVTALTETVDCILLGRKLAESFIPYWASHPGEEGAENINQTPKIVFSKTLTESPWVNTKLATGDLVAEVTQLKNETGKDIIVYGGANFISELIKYKLIDEFYLLVNPTLIGNGMAIFHDIPSTQHLELKDTTGFQCGITVIHYELK
ncbi:MAG: dihydrofolate reductase family protein [Bacteroidota bacterium]